MAVVGRSCTGGLVLLLTPLGIAIVVALLQGGSLRGLAAVPLRHGELLMISLLIQVALYLPGLRTAHLILHWGGLIYVGALLLALLAALSNWRLGIAARLATLGLALNMLTIVVNNGFMPVNTDAMRIVQGEAKVREIASHGLYGNTRLATPATRLVLLTDIIPVRLPGGRGNVYSIGDTLLAAGVATLAYRATRRAAQPLPTQYASTTLDGQLDSPRPPIQQDRHVG
jgi:hypothetical protein